MTGPKRVLRTFDATSMVTGNMIGSGIFLLAGYAAASVPDSSTLILAWIGGGVGGCYANRPNLSMVWITLGSLSTYDPQCRMGNSL